MYVCGPTVYDASHLGHARTYLQFDVIRRILRDVLGYEVTYVMNITDVDDKIIIRSAERNVAPELLARKWEARFLEDMAALGVERPTCMPRVTEYIEEIIAFVAKIVDRGFGYENAGSIYFDTRAFSASGYDYGKLVPEAVGDDALLAEGEGKLAATVTCKRDARDFALWKASKPGEPTWPSPWGEGRPGWHIECSAMIDATIGEGGAIDIHGGGIDLRFPHHDNELAQSEAFCACHQTVNYFAHTGHLHIRGLKMSKSLKNFITIRQALEGVDGMEPVRPSTMRLMFCLVSYTAPCDYSDNMLGNARAVEKKFRELFLNVATTLRKADSDITSARHKVRPRDAALLAAVVATQTRVRARFLDNFDTPGAILALQGLVDAVGTYLDAHDRDKKLGAPRTLPLCAATRYVAETLLNLGIVGLVADDILCRLRMFPAPIFGATGLAIGTGSAAAIIPLLDVIAEFRDNIRGAGRTQDTSKVLSLCDELRDLTLPELGVRLEDKGATSVWKLEDPAVLRSERALKAQDASAKEEAKRLDAVKRAAKEEAASLHPHDMFKQVDKKYARFDNNGIPTHNSVGQPLPKSQIKKLKKEWEKQKRLYDKAHSM